VTRVHRQVSEQQVGIVTTCARSGIADPCADWEANGTSEGLVMRPELALRATERGLLVMGSPSSGSGSDRRGGGERADDGEAREVGDRGGEKRLEGGLAPPSIAGLSHPEVLEVVDRALHLGAPTKEGRCLGILLGGTGGGHAIRMAGDEDTLAPTGSPGGPSRGWREEP